jgi:hypothetical protein
VRVYDARPCILHTEAENDLLIISIITLKGWLDHQDAKWRGQLKDEAETNTRRRKCILSYLRLSSFKQKFYGSNIIFSWLCAEFGSLKISKSSKNTCLAGLVRQKVGILSCH